MQRTRRGEPVAINQALNKPRTQARVELANLDGHCDCVVAGSPASVLLLSILIFLSITAVCWLIVRKHPKMFQLWGLSFTQKSYYDPRKR